MTIVTGGAGFIGTHLVELLATQGAELRVVEKPGVDASHLPTCVELVYADIRDRSSLDAALRGGRFVFHLAANPNLWARDPTEFDAVNHLGTVNVLDAAIASGAERIVHCSTESILTCSRQNTPIDESVEIEDTDAVGPYCLSKLRAERAAHARAAAGHCVLVANPTMPVGPGDRGLSPPTRLIRDFCEGRLIASMDATLNLIDVRDAALGLLKVMERGRPGRRYLLGAENLSLSQLLAQLSAYTGVSVPQWRVPYWFGLCFAQLSEFWATFFSKQPPKASVTGVRLTRRTMHFDSSNSLNELCLVPRPVHQALIDSVDWLIQTGRIQPARRFHITR
jgi:dihydroflavonol-4-reductase